MSVRVDIAIAGAQIEGDRAIEFYADSQWNQMAEINIIKTLREIFTIARPLGETLQLELTISSPDPGRLKLLIQKNIFKQTPIENHSLSAREIEICNLIIQGFTNKEIAEKTYISFETVRSHRKNILSKTKCSNTAMLINYFHNAFHDDKA